MDVAARPHTRVPTAKRAALFFGSCGSHQRRASNSTPCCPRGQTRDSGIGRSTHSSPMDSPKHTATSFPSPTDEHSEMLIRAVRKHGELNAAPNVQFREDASQMHLDGANGHRQAFRDVAVRRAAYRMHRDF